MCLGPSAAVVLRGGPDRFRDLLYKDGNRHAKLSVSFCSACPDGGWRPELGVCAVSFRRQMWVRSKNSLSPCSNGRRHHPRTATLHVECADGSHYVGVPPSRVCLGSTRLAGPILTPRASRRDFWSPAFDGVDEPW